jgi:uncharacterized protein (TIGR00369 family)
MNTTDTAGLIDFVPFAAALGIQIVDVKPDNVTATMGWVPERCTSGAILHGGALMAFADTVGALCAVVNLPPGANTVTIESKTNFFRAVRDGAVTANCTPLHVGRRDIVVQTSLTNDRDQLVAQTTQTQAVLAPPSGNTTSQGESQGT